MLAENRAAEQRARQAKYDQDRVGWTGDCATCLDTGTHYLTLADCACRAGEQRRIARERHAEEARIEAVSRAYEQTIANAQFPLDYGAWTLENFPRKTVQVKRIQEWVTRWDGQSGLILFGPYGTGKTSLMIGLMKAIVMQHVQHERGPIRASFMRASDLMTRLRAAMDDEDGAYDRLMTRAKQVRIFALDDIGRENPKSDWMSETLFEIIDERYSHSLPIFATTNYSPDTIGARLGVNAEAIMERLNDRCVWMRITGASMRQSQARVIE